VDNQYIQNLRYKLQKRFRRLNSASYMNYRAVLTRFWAFIQGHDIFVSLIAELLARQPGADPDAARVFEGREVLFGETDEEAAAIGVRVIEHCIAADRDSTPAIQIAHKYCDEGQHNAALPHFTENFVEPVYEFLDEELDDVGAVLALLRRYKQRVEWFERGRLAKQWSDNTDLGEKMLAMDLYEFLFDQGVELYIEPKSASGKADMISSQEGDERLLADAKVFDAAGGRSKSYIAKGLGQIHSYAVDYNEPVGYLVVFNVSPEILKFAVAGSSQSIPFISISGKTIFLLVIDLHLHEKSASKRGVLKVHEISEDFLIKDLAAGEGV
jgi:hypothetical protein